MLQQLPHDPRFPRFRLNDTVFLILYGNLKSYYNGADLWDALTLYY